MKSMLAKQAPHSSPWLDDAPPARDADRRQQEIGERPSIGRSKAAPAPLVAVAGEAGGSRPSSASPIAMAL